MNEYIILEAGGTSDAADFMRCIEALGGEDLNPPTTALAASQSNPSCVFIEDGRKVFTIRDLTTDELLKNSAILGYVKQIEHLQPKWAYLSGHTGTYGYSGNMNKLPPGKGHAHYTFSDGTLYLTDNDAKRFWKKIDTSRTGKNCVAVIVMGCAVTDNAHHMGNLQRAFGAGGKPVILGWSGICPTKDIDKRFVINAFFIDRVKAKISGDVRSEHRELLVKLWGEVGEFYPNIGAFDHEGRRWKVEGDKGKKKWVADR